MYLTESATTMLAMTQARTATLYLIDAEDDVDERILRRWVAEHAPDADVLPLTQSASDPTLARVLAGDRDVLLGALRVAWLPRERGGDRTVRIRDFLSSGDPHNPSRRRKEKILRSSPDCARVVVAEPAPLSEVR